MEVEERLRVAARAAAVSGEGRGKSFLKLLTRSDVVERLRSGHLLLVIGHGFCAGSPELAPRPTVGLHCRGWGELRSGGWHGQ